MAGLRILAVNTPLAPALREMGHTVLDLFLENGPHHLPDILARHGFTPDLVLHMENLGLRGLLSGLPEARCPKVFWSVDTHLNSWWHRWYGRLYDLTLTTQAPWVPRLEALGLPRVAHLPAPGAAAPWVPHAERPEALAFVGRLTPQRPARQWMVDMVQRTAPCAVAQDVPPHLVVSRYSRARTVPNESILGEVNFRLFEAASAGCLVLHQEGEAEISGLFSSGVEILTYSHSLELERLLRRAVDRPDEAERLGRAAWERVQREHLPGRRAARIMDLARDLPAAAATGKDAELAWWMTLFHLHEAGMFRADPETLASALAGLDAAPARAALLRLLAMEGRREAAVSRMLELLERGTRPDAEVDQAASAAALKLGLFDLAKRFWYRRWEARTRDGAKTRFDQPSDPAHLHKLWAAELSRLGRTMRPGMPFDEARHIPASAVECLFSAKVISGTDLDLERRLAALLGQVPGQEHMRMGLLSHLSLHHPADWRISLELALVNLRAFRPGEGLAELAAARESARRAGQEDRFRRALLARDPGRTALAALLAGTPATDA
ncbi:MAG: glycosyltransferase [Thermodesulfobacteriota bacterium]